MDICLTKPTPLLPTVFLFGNYFFEGCTDSNVPFGRIFTT